ncbi:transglutaminase-like cysteine peptidase [Methylobacterium sp. E-025]|uniref:transglutaminase-like cysteine peptidase n=2 Tax=Methylobacterium TaxID=407 RepID=UPI001FB94D99|nr:MULTISPECIES: transglutaminase-like cysteine peptidase [unclassified Methylobacterium]MCJ2038971.1 transglutaminase-like cysteine peptidase [Methylobacterium sp. J-059]MCJ2110386.1 transglutaminase-like cysteine peptidase [Methylobacterium sp. E-025]
MIGGASTQPRIAALPPDAATAVETGPAARPVAAWTEFCRRMPAECDVDTREPATIAMNTALWRTLASVNRRVNARIRPITDQAHWGVVDRWDFPDDGFGDCEDYQLLKRRMLIERGLPRRALRMTVVIDDIGEGHAVLMVRTDRGDFILDNKTNTILSWRNTGYAYIKREGQDGRAWVTLDGGASPVATANR